ncbi:MAG TPA: flagellar biosynthetic protein FliO [Cellvibrionaceae bacterium]
MTKLSKKLSVFWVLILGAGHLLAAETSEVVPASPSIGNAQHLSSILLGLIAIVVLIFGLAWFYRKATGGAWMRSGDIKVVSALALGTRERLLVVDVAGQQLLLGVTAQTISTLHVFDEPVVKNDSASSTSDFSEKLQSFLQRQQKD